MTQIEEQRFLRAGELREAGRLRDALQEYGALVETITDPIDRAGVLLNKVSCLRELGELDLAREGLGELKTLVSATAGVPLDTEDESREPFLVVGIRFEEAELYLAHGKEKEALAKLDELLREYPQQLGTPFNRSLFEAVQTRRAFILADLDRCAEAKPILEEACSFEHDRPYTYYYLGHCYCRLGETKLAHKYLTEALRLGLPTDPEYRAHYSLGIVYHKLEAYARAKQEFELCAQKADKAYIGQARLWQWLASTCEKLGLDSEAERYARLARKG